MTIKALVCQQTIYHFNNDHRENGARPVTLRVIEPSKAHGGWPGNNYQIREWKICRPGTYHMDACTDQEMFDFEQLFGQVSHADLGFADHPTLGRVAVRLR